MNILITGANGQLGNEMRILSAQHPKHTYLFSDVFVPENSPVTVHPLDITDEAAVCGFVGEHCVDLIVNCAAYTNVDKAEQDEPVALKINADAVANLARSGARLIHISTDYVFSGDEHLPCREQDPVAPRTAYGRTKYAGEQALLAIQPDAIIFRTAWLYSEYGNNFMKTMIRLGQTKPEIGVVYDQIGTPTYALDLAQAIFAAIEADEWKAGIYHYTNEGVCSWYDFTLAIHEVYNMYLAHGMKQGEPIRCRVKPILSEEYQYLTPRPHYSVLNKAKVKQTFGIQIPHWRDSLIACMQNMQ
jgi:dTDP-4-dehydrorhamnose reductase